MANERPLEFDQDPRRRKPSSRERVEFTLAPDLPGVHVIIFEYSRSTAKMFHENYDISTVLSGRRRWACNGETYCALPGMVQSWEPGDTHHCLERAFTNQRVLLVPPAVMKETAADMGIELGRLRVKNRQVSRPRVFEAFRALHRALEEPATRLERQSLFFGCMRMILRCAYGDKSRPPVLPKAPDVLGRVRDYIEDHFAAGVGLGQLAEVAGLSRFHLLRLFKTHFGTTPHSFQIDLKVARARELLMKGEELVGVAAKVGFSDQSHLTRHFKRLYGLTPSRFRVPPAPPVRTPGRAR